MSLCKNLISVRDDAPGPELTVRSVEVPVLLLGVAEEIEVSAEALIAAVTSASDVLEMASSPSSTSASAEGLLAFSGAQAASAEHRKSHGAPRLHRLRGRASVVASGVGGRSRSARMRA